MLARKTAKQAKARWNEYLDPRLNKSEWTQDLDVKLLELARLIPNQWRTIASKLGRTATQCIERYQTLLDYEGSSEMDLAGPGIETLESVGASTDFKLGDINVNPETAEAIPDAVDLDEDEKEMLSEARARLANTKGKKATRKQRERMLEESRRVALLQKRRDLKQAGINTELKGPRKKFATQMDFNADIPFEHTPVTGFYDTTEETEANKQSLQNFEFSVNKIGLKDDKEKKNKNKRERDDKNHVEEISELLPENYNKKPKLELPKPVFGDDKLMEMIKDGEDIDEKAKQVVFQKSKDIDDSINQLARQIKESKAEKSALLTTAIEEEEESIEEEETEAEELGVSIKAETSASKPFSLAEQLAALPAPKNDFELLDEESEDEEMRQEIEILEEDEGEKERLRKIDEENEIQKALLRRSQVVQLDLDIPNLPARFLLEPIDNKPIRKEIDRELVKLIRSDYAKVNRVAGIPLIGDLTESAKNKITSLISLEINDEDLVRFQTEFSSKHKIVIQDQLTEEQKEVLVGRLSDLMLVSNDDEKSLENKFSDLIATNDELNEKYLKILSEIKDADRTLIAFDQLYTKESSDIDERLSKLRGEVDVLVQAEQKVQEGYLELKRLSN